MTLSYRNPLVPFDFADPFVLKTNDEYYAYGTATAPEDGRIFPVLRSTDLVHWERLGGALEPLRDPSAFSYWAPEVAVCEGRFYLFYSASTTQSDADHRLRVAIADHPAGPFKDSGNLVIPGDSFSIDASPFRDPRTGRWYLFYATDYVSDAPTGTGLAVAELAGDLRSIVTEPKIVVRAQADWQIYERERQYKGQLWPKWYCLEGPDVIYHNEKYYCLYSGGAWHGDTYGVGFATADNPLGPWRDDFALHGASVLKGIKNKVIGPGHSSHVVGTDGRTIYLVYHAWDVAKTARRMCIDPLLWTAAGPKADGPSTDFRHISSREGDSKNGTYKIET